MCLFGLLSLVTSHIAVLHLDGAFAWAEAFFGNCLQMECYLPYVKFAYLCLHL